MYLLFEKQITEYDDNYRSLIKKELYKYDDCGYLKEQTFLLPEGDSLITSFKYLEKMPSYITDKTQVIRNSGKVKSVQSEHFDYLMQEGRGKEWPVLSSYYSGTDKQHLEKRIAYLKYDCNGNPVHIEKDGKSYLYIWGYDGQYLIAKIENATYEELMEALDGNSPENISGQSDYLVFAGKVEGVREKLPRAMVTNYTYIPNVGVSSETFPNGQSIYYEYDIKGRLEKSYRIGENGKREILQLNEYHLINE